MQPSVTNSVESNRLVTFITAKKIVIGLQHLFKRELKITSVYIIICFL